MSDKEKLREELEKRHVGPAEDQGYVEVQRVGSEGDADLVIETQHKGSEYRMIDMHWEKATSWGERWRRWWGADIFVNGVPALKVFAVVVVVILVGIGLLFK
ncbi:hypothetical protein CMI37_22670 [Candidatus Pacearchaeota archaeon]|nr:hypothetical protein [Candidatus Pacearchaeota archaeon]|tara:strand:- start:348 stop:653 length:306 start_codon:yes stop_codon:yes gene_type:complete